MSNNELDNEGLETWADIVKEKVYDKNIKGKCCFCGKEFLGYGNDPRPIKIAGEENPRCCNECNLRIVNATRQAVWSVGEEKDLVDCKCAFVGEVKEK